jgi:phosphocarrier protein
MKSFQYTIKDELGIHARPAGLLVKEAKNYESNITLEAGGKSADVSRLMALMALGIKQGVEVTITAEGPDEDAAIAGMEAFFKENL